MYYYYSPLCVLWYLLFYWWKYFIGVKSTFYEIPLRGHGCSLSHDRLACKSYFSLPQLGHESTNAHGHINFFIQLDPTLRSIVHTWSIIEDIMILLQWMMWCIFYVGFVRDPASILVGFVGDPPSVILCKHDCRIVKSTHQQHIKHSKKNTILNA